ncbi:RNA-guided endonuclease InsQ/TnpB family protein [Pseudanabaena sp. PCC 6802]|uniref:RNA-guided endonuclease InsQ/TnpB family protein n=1 Tax=Pseudanabaena sp. PCC 6802 TaxID=118173 RepID=UPI000345457D|nr:RNA-guided endonuclease TnpB family protein [Pseudanabaena sp. PCC 6802]
MLTRRITFRLYPKPAQEAKLFEWRRLHAYLYNSALADRKDSYQKRGEKVDYFDRQNRLPAFKEVWAEYKELGSHALQATLKRVDFAFQRFFAGLGGYPRFKSIRDYSGWTYPCSSGWKAHTTGNNGYLDLSNLGQIQMRGKARTWGTPSTCTILYRRRKWFASITVQCEPVRETGIGAIGIDFGCLTAAAMSDSTMIENPRFMAKTQTKIKIASKQKRRKQSPNFKKKVKASKRWKKAQKRVSALQRKAANQRQDWVHKQAAEIVSCNSLVATEKLNLKGMTAKAKKGKRKRQKSGLNRSVLDVGMGMFRKALEYKLVEAGGIFVEVPTQKVKPSQTCPNCGHQEKKTLDRRVHRCSQCGCVEDRDVAAAKVMLNWALGLGTSLINAESLSSTTETRSKGSLRQLGAKKRQKPLAQRSG